MVCCDIIIVDNKAVLPRSEHYSMGLIKHFYIILIIVLKHILQIPLTHNSVPINLFRDFLIFL